MQTYRTIPPGETINDLLNDRNYNFRKFCSDMNMTETEVHKIISGEITIDTQIANRLKKIFGIPTQFWPNLESNYRKDLKQQSEELLALSCLDEYNLFKFQERLSKASEDYQSLLAHCQKIRQKLQEYDETSEIEKYRKQAEDIRRHALAILSPVEHKKDCTFRSQHYKSCKNGEIFQYTLSGTGFAPCVSIRCPFCGKEEDITDNKNW